MKDVFVDNDLSAHFARPILPEYIAFIKWLAVDGALVVTQHLIKEYTATCGGCRAPTCLPLLVELLQRKGRINHIKKEQLELLKIPKVRENALLSNRKDHYHLKAVLLSFRKIALTTDKNFTKDLCGYPGYVVLVAESPCKVNYV